MKKMFIAIASAILFYIVSMGQSSHPALVIPLDEKPDTVLVHLEAFVNGISITDDMTDQRMDSLNTQYRAFTEWYDSNVNDMSANQLKSYHKYTTQYKKTISQYYTKRTENNRVYIK